MSPFHLPSKLKLKRALDEVVSRGPHGGYGRHTDSHEKEESSLERVASRRSSDEYDREIEERIVEYKRTQMYAAAFGAGLCF